MLCLSTISSVAKKLSFLASIGVTQTILHAALVERVVNEFTKRNVKMPHDSIIRSETFH